MSMMCNLNSAVVGPKSMIHQRDVCLISVRGSHFDGIYIEAIYMPQNFLVQIQWPTLAPHARAFAPWVARNTDVGYTIPVVRRLF